MISLKQIFKDYYTPSGILPVLSDINLEIHAGEIFGIIGKSGAGKSTLIRCVNLLERPTRGRVIVGQQDLTALNKRALRQARQKMGMIFQHFNLLSTRTVYQNVAFPLTIARMSASEIEKRVTPLLELTGLTDKKDCYPAQLSGGQKQRVAIARALASKPEILLSDEATSALDPETTIAILRLLKDIRDNLKLTILLITHEMQVIKSCCDRVALLEAGQIIEQQEVGEFFTHPKTLTAKNFIASTVLQHLPEALEKEIIPIEQPNTHPVIRLWFLQGTATQPIISLLSQRFGIAINILQANVEHIKKHTMGIMLVVLRGEREQTQPAIAYLKTLNIDVEVVGYVSNDIIPAA